MKSIFHTLVQKVTSWRWLSNLICSGGKVLHAEVFLKLSDFFRKRVDACRWVSATKFPWQAIVCRQIDKWKSLCIFMRYHHHLRQHDHHDIHHRRLDCLPMNCLLEGNHEVAINGLSTNTYLDYDCPKFITPTFITSDIHTFITPYLKSDIHHPDIHHLRHSSPIVVESVIHHPRRSSPQTFITPYLKSDIHHLRRSSPPT